MMLYSAKIILFLALFFGAASCRSDGRIEPESSSKIYSSSYDNQSSRDSVQHSVSGSRRTAITQAVSKASGAVVGINVTEIQERAQQSFYDPFGLFERYAPRIRQEVKSLGSGFIISSDGYVLTNDHVAGNAIKIIVTMTNGEEYDAKLIATDPVADVALLKVNAKNLPYLPLGNSDDLAIGEWAIAMGNPFGLFSINDKPTVTVGVVSNTGVNLGLMDRRNYRNMIQTDAAISSGNSGGPLLNAMGEVIGINATIFSTSQGSQGAGSIGLGFAIPINKVKPIIQQLKSGKAFVYYTGDPGFRVSDLDGRMKDYFNTKVRNGVVITGLLRNGAAANAGLTVGDVITEVDRAPMKSVDELQSLLAEHRTGDSIKLTVVRGDTKHTVRLSLTNN